MKITKRDIRIAILETLLETNGDPKKTAVKSQVDKAVEDILNGDLSFSQLPATIQDDVKSELERRVAEKQRGAPVRGGVDLSSFEGMDVEGLLSSMGIDPDFDFESEFERGMSRDPVRAGQPGVGVEPAVEHEAGFPREDEPTPLRFQPSQPYYRGEEGVVSKDFKSRDEVKQAVLKTLMDEFVAPAMSVGMNILPAVWSELGRLMRADPDGFRAGFQIALNQIRDMENQWFAKLLSFSGHPQAQMNVPDEQQETVERIRMVLERYYDAVLREAGRNSGNLSRSLSRIRGSTDEMTFEEGFFDALSDTRDVEDQAFLQFMGGPRRLPQRESLITRRQLRQLILKEMRSKLSAT